MISARHDIGKLDCPCGDQPLECAPAPAAVVSEWRTQELKELQDALNRVLRAEGVLFEGVDIGADDVESFGRNGEPESEAPAANEAMQAGIERLRLAVMRQVITPLLESPWPAREADAVPLRQLPMVVEHTTLLLKKTWGLASARGQQVQQLSKECDAKEAEVRSLSDRLSREEAGRLAAEAEAGQGEKAHDMLEGTVSRLTAARKTIKDQEWELTVSRRRNEDMQRERTLQEKRIRDLETALERHVRAQSEAERRVSEAISEADAEAAQQRGDLRRQLATTELARDGAQAEAAAASMREKEAEKQVAELQHQLDASKLAHQEAQTEAVQECDNLRVLLSAAEAQLAQAQADRADQEEKTRASTERQIAELEAQLSEKQEQLAESNSAKDHLDQQFQRCIAHIADRQAAEESRDSDEHRRRPATQTPQRERPARQSGAGLPRAGFGMGAARPPPAVRRSKGGLQHSASDQGIEAESESQSSSLARPSPQKSMPMDLKSLGKLLAGSGVMNKGNA